MAALQSNKIEGDIEFLCSALTGPNSTVLDVSKMWEDRTRAIAADCSGKDPEVICPASCCDCF